MHVTRAEFYQELRQFTAWAERQFAGIRHRMLVLETNEEIDMSIIAGDIGALQGLVNQVESALSGQKDRITALEGKLAEGDETAAADHAELVSGHEQLTSLTQSLRDALEGLSPATPGPDVVAPAPGTDTADPTQPSGGAGMAGSVPEGQPVVPGGETQTVDTGDSDASGDSGSADSSATSDSSNA